MRALTIFILVALAGFQVSCASGEKQAPNDPGPEAERRAALVAAQQFLALVDGAAIDQTYELVASSRKARTDGPAWEAAVAELRHASGKVLSRELRGYGYMGNVPDAPPGTYFVIEYRALFSSRLWLEKIVVSHEPDGWRIADYSLTRVS